MSLRQIFLVIKREYMTRIKSKAFILVTILLPLGMIAFVGVTIGIALWETETEHKISVLDETGDLYPRLVEIDSDRYQDAGSLSVDSLRSMVISKDIEGYIVLNDMHVDSTTSTELVYGGGGGITFLNSVESDLRDVIREERLARANVSEDVRNIYSSSAEMVTRKLSEEGIEEDDDAGFRTGIGMVMGVIIFGVLFGYGGWLTRSVIEEKTSRIIEVIASSVKPIELLIGKILGIAGLAVSQFAVWIITGIGLTAAATPIAAMFLGGQAENLEGAEVGAEMAMFEIPTIETSLIIYFILFFILGYLIYSSLFAAIGSAVDSETDTQQLMLPISAPIFIAYLLLFRIVEAPDSSLAVISSLVPFFSPILMISRIAITDVPFWEIGTSVVLMLLTFAGTMWLSAKIYSVGILSYGKSANFRELWKWIKQG